MAARPPPSGYEDVLRAQMKGEVQVRTLRGSLIGKRNSTWPSPRRGASSRATVSRADESKADPGTRWPPSTPDEWRDCGVMLVLYFRDNPLTGDYLRHIM